MPTPTTSPPLHPITAFPSPPQRALPSAFSARSEPANKVPRRGNDAKDMALLDVYPTLLRGRDHHRPKHLVWLRRGQLPPIFYFPGIRAKLAPIIAPPLRFIITRLRARLGQARLGALQKTMQRVLPLPPKSQLLLTLPPAPSPSRKQRISVHSIRTREKPLKATTPSQYDQPASRLETSSRPQPNIISRARSLPEWHARRNTARRTKAYSARIYNLLDDGDYTDSSFGSGGNGRTSVERAVIREPSFSVDSGQLIVTSRAVSTGCPPQVWRLLVLDLLVAFLFIDPRGILLLFLSAYKTVSRYPSYPRSSSLPRE